MKETVKTQLAETADDPVVMQSLAALSTDLPELAAALDDLQLLDNVSGLDELPEDELVQKLDLALRLVIAKRNLSAGQSQTRGYRLLRLLAQVEAGGVPINYCGQVGHGYEGPLAESLRAEIEACRTELSRHYTGCCFRCSAVRLTEKTASGWRTYCADDCRHLSVTVRWPTNDREQIRWTWSEPGTTETHTFEIARTADGGICAGYYVQ